VRWGLGLAVALLTDDLDEAWRVAEAVGCGLGQPRAFDAY
jgi:hypothetical protein